MNKDLEEKLVRDFPNLFKGRDLPLTQNLMSFGCECDDGWFQIIYDLCEKIKDSGAYFTQIKEKNAALAIHMFLATNEVYDLVEEAEDASITVCEICAKKATLCVRYGWYKTLCPDCREELEFKEVEGKPILRLRLKDFE